MRTTPPAGLGIFIWEWSQCDGGDIDKIVARCKRCNISWVAVHMPDVTTARVAKLKAAGLYVAAWKYCVPGDDFITHAVLCRASGCDAILPDCEIEWESRDGAPADRRPEALIFAQKLRNALGPDCFIGNCGAWQWPDEHSVYPDHAFGNYWNSGMPERYWTMFSPNHSPKSVLDESDRQWADRENVNAYKQLIPIGSAFDGTGQGGQALRPEDVSDFLDRQPTCALWSYQHVSQDVWAILEARAMTHISTMPPPEGSV